MIEVSGLRFTWPGSGEETLRGLDFRVEDGEVFGFLGPSGAGKSTTQKILTGALRGYAGAVTVMGRSPADWGSDLYRRVGVAFEVPNLYLRLTARENLRFFAALHGREVDADALLARVGLEADADRRVAEFSKGMRMRLNVARSLLHDPALLFLDEPTAGQDPVNARRVRGLIREAAQGRTVFLTTHDMAVAAEVCDRVAFLVDGRICALDSPRALMLAAGARAVRVEHRGPAGIEVDELPLDGLGVNERFLGLLRAGVVETLHSREATLEDVFVRVTGRQLQ